MNRKNFSSNVPNQYHSNQLPSTTPGNMSQQLSQTTNSINKYSNTNSFNNPNTNVNNTNEVDLEGVYKNGRLMHTATSLIGCLVEVELANGDRFEGIFNTFSPKFEIVLFSASAILSNDKQNQTNLGSNFNNLVTCLEQKTEILEKIVFQPTDMVKIRALNVDLEYATTDTSKKSCFTDGEIANLDGNRKAGAPRDLVPWDGGDDEKNCLDTLENSNGIPNGKGWEAEDMLNYNAKKFNINSTYRDEMPEYTIQLQPRNDDDYRQREVQAEMLAREIEKDVKRQVRLAKENNDDIDEETRYSAVVVDDGDRSHTSNINNSPRSEVSHTSQREDRRDVMRNNSDGFRTQNNRNNRSSRGGGGNRNDRATNDNWRNPDRMNANRFNPTNQPAPPYNTNSNNNYNNPKQSGNSNPPLSSSTYSGGPTKPYAGPSSNTAVVNPVISGNVPPTQYSQTTSTTKTSYSAIARHTSHDSMSNDNDPKQYGNRGHGNKAEHYHNEHDPYCRRSGGSGSGSGVGVPPREQREYKQRSGSRISEHEPIKSPNANQPSSFKNDTDQPKNRSTPSNTPPVTATPPVSSPAESSPNQKAQSPVKSDLGAHPQLTNRGRSIDDNSQPEVIRSKGVEMKKQDSSSSSFNQTVETTMNTSSELPKTESESKKDSAASPGSTGQVNTAAERNPDANGGEVSSSASTSNSVHPNPEQPTNQPKQSKLNPEAKSFTPRTNPTPQYIQPNQQMVANFQYQQQHISTSPPSQGIPNQMYQMAPHLTHQQQAQLRSNYMSYTPYITPQMVQGVPPHSYISMGPGGIPQPVFTGPVPGVPSGINQGAVPNQPGPGGQMPPHHMVPNGPAGQTPSNQQQQQQQQSQQGPPSRNQYRGSNKSGTSHGNGPSQQATQFIRHGQQPSLMEYVPQSQVANVTGQPIMATTVQQGQMQTVYSAAGPVHSQHHHHQAPQHGPQPPNMGAGPMAPQPGQPMAAYPLYTNLAGGRLNLYPQPHSTMQFPGAMQVFDPSGIAMLMPNCDCPPQMVPQQMPNAVQQTNPNMQSSAPAIPSAAPSNAAPNSNQVVPQGGPPPQQQAY